MSTNVISSSSVSRDNVSNVVNTNSEEKESTKVKPVDVKDSESQSWGQTLDRTLTTMGKVVEVGSFVLQIGALLAPFIINRSPPSRSPAQWLKSSPPPIWESPCFPRTTEYVKKA